MNDETLGVETRQIDLSQRAIVKQADEVPSDEVRAGTDTRVQMLLTAAEGAPNFAMRKFIMGEGGGMPLHANEVEHEQYVLAGRAKVVIQGEAFEVGPGSVLFIPAGAAHSYEVLEGPFEFLCMIPNFPDRIEIFQKPP